MLQLLFINGFAKSFYSNYFTMSCRADPCFYLPGYNSCLCIELCYIMKNHIERLAADGGLECNEAFAPYLRGLQYIPDDDEVSDGNKQFFADMVKVFFQEFLATYAVHIESVWLHPNILIYILGGNPVLACEFIRWLYHYEENIQFPSYT